MENLNNSSTLLIEDSIRELAISFAERFSEIEMRYLKLRYDFTFPSIGSVERAIAHLRFNDSLTNKEEELLRGAACYLTMIAAHAWASIPDNLTVSAKIPSAGDIVLEVSGGAFLKSDSSFSVGVLSSLKKVFKSKRLNYFENISRDIGPTDPVVEPFALGLISGLCPSGNGPWKNLSAPEFAAYIEPITKFLARTSAQYYEKVFNEGSLDDLSELFLSSLILPPHGYDEPFFGLRGATLLLEYLNKEGYSDKAQLELAQNLASMPTEQISSIGKIISLALSDLPQTSKYQINPKLRGAVCAIRQRLSGELDWLSLINNKTFSTNEQIELIQNSFQRERNQQLIPNINLPGRLLVNEKCLPLFNTLAWNNLELAINGCESMLQAHACDDFAILLQNIALLLEAGDLNTAIEKHALATMAVSSASIDQLAIYLQLGGEIAFRFGKYDESYEYLKRGVTQTLFDSDDTIFGMLLRALVHQEKFEKVLEIGEDYRERFPFSANIALPLCVAALQTNNEPIAQQLLSEVLWNDPNNQAAFWLGLRV